MFEVIFEDVVRLVPLGWAFLAVEGLYKPYLSDYLVIITKNFANLPFLLMQADPLRTEHLSFYREGNALFLEVELPVLTFRKIIILFRVLAICIVPLCHFIPVMNKVKERAVSRVSVLLDEWRMWICEDHDGLILLCDVM